jgi:choline-sulfatase
MIRSGQWKYCYYHEDREQLFDLKNDPGETVNLAGRPEHAALAAPLKARALAGWRLDGYRSRGRSRQKKQKG